MQPSHRVIPAQVKNSRNPDENKAVAFRGVSFLHSKKIVSNIIYHI